MTTAEATECVHHYVLPAPSGPTVSGACKKCGHVREYSSSGDAQITSEWAQAQVNRTNNSLISRGHKPKNTFNAGTPLSMPSDRSYVRPVDKAEKQPRKKAVRPEGQPYYQHPLTRQQAALLAYVKEHGSVGTREASDALDEDLTLTGVRMRALVGRGLLDRNDSRSKVGAYTYRPRNATPLCAPDDRNAVLISKGEEVVNTEQH